VPNPLSLPCPHYNALSYHRLSQPFYSCLLSISSVSTPKSIGDALVHPRWRQTMLDEMSALKKNGTWDLVPLRSRKSVDDCKWIFAINVGLDGTIDRLKARIVAKGYTKFFGDFSSFIHSHGCSSTMASISN